VPSQSGGAEEEEGEREVEEYEMEVQWLREQTVLYEWYSLLFTSES
jgi:hypothetical protein